MAHPGASRQDVVGARRGMRLPDLLTLKDQTDAAGRLLLEDSAPKRARKNAARAGAATRTAPCPYKDTPSRTGGVMNVAAYEALRRDTGEILDGFAWLTAHYRMATGAEAGSIGLLVDVSNLGVTMPLVLFRRTRDPVPPHGSLPSYVASIFKASRGVFSAAVDLMNKEGPPERRVTGAEVVAFSDREGHLMRPQTRRACAAPTRLIERTLDVLLTGTGASAEDSRLGELVRFPELWEFYSLERSFAEASSRYRYVLENLLETAGTRDPRQVFDAVLVDGSRRSTFAEFSEGFVEHANGVQSALNRVLGRADNAPPLTFQDVLRLL